MIRKILQFSLVFSLLICYAFANDSNLDNQKSTSEKNLTMTNYHEGWNDGHCEGWKEERGKNAYCPYPPYPPYPKYPKSPDSYRDGYNDGYRRGMSDARK